MKVIAAFLIVVAVGAAIYVLSGTSASAAGAGARRLTAAAAQMSGGEAVPIYGIKIPAGYRDWRLVSVAHEEGNLHSIGAVLGNDTAVEAYRAGKLPFPDGTILAALHYSHVPSDENNKVFGDAQSFVAGAPTNVQFMVKDSKKYASTGGWGYAHFNKDGTPGTDAQMKTCAPCHAKAVRDSVFTIYAH